MNKRGFTLTELLIALGMMSILILLGFHILFLNFKVFNKTEANVEIQQQGQFLKQFIENKLYLSYGLDSIVDMNGKKIKSQDFEEGEIKELRFRLEDIVVGIYINPKNKKMFYRKDLLYNGYEIGDYVKKMKVENRRNGKGVKINLELEKKSEQIEVDFVVYFRNYKE